MAGIVEHGKGARLFVLMSTLQEMSGAHDKASIFFVKCDRSDHTAAQSTDEISSCCRATRFGRSRITSR